MKIAVTSQNRKTITEHAGRCRKFYLFVIENNKVINKQLVEFPKEQSFHESDPHAPHPLDDIDVLITGGMGEGLIRRLERKGIHGIVTKEDDPERAVSLYLDGSLAKERPHRHDHGHDESL
jgi:predicted Fe-Mo cluster-binding NifX family protein